MKMEPRVYTKYRNQLLEITKPIAEFKELDMESREAFKLTTEKLQSESFEIALVGEFQGGKSTTFNAICDGREISPMGIGIKTSACRISAQNLVNPSEKERAVIRWKSDDELILTVLDILKKHLPDSEFQNISARDNEGHFENLSLKDSNDVHLINTCLDKEWAEYKASPARYDQELSGKLDLLYVASICMHFLKDSHIVNLRKQEIVVSLDEMKQYVKFPLDWSERWGQYTPSAFRSTEIVFAFIADVHCYIHSPNLRRLGCIITDCPGLFAGPWDTKVAHEAMRQADAILYLLPGEKAIGITELKALKEIQRAKQYHKVFFAMNARTSYAHLRDVIRKPNAANINNCLGESAIPEKGAAGNPQIKPEDISIFNTFLAYNAKHFPILQAEGNDAQLSEWKKVTRRAICTFLDLDVDDDASKIQEYLANPESISEACQYDNLLDTIEARVVTQKAYSLLYQNGVVPLNNSLVELEGKLHLREDQARKGYANAKEEAETALRILNEYKVKSMQIVREELNDPAVATVIVDDFIKQVFLEQTSAISSNIMQNISIVLNNTSKSVVYIVEMLKQKFGLSKNSRQATEEGFSRTIQSFVSQAIEEECQPAAAGWVNNITQENNNLYKITIGAKLKNIYFRIKQLWKDLILTAPEEIRAYFKGLKPDIEVGGDPAIEITNAFDVSGLLKEIRSSMLKMLMVNIAAMIAGALVAGVTAIITGILLIVILNPAAWIAVPVMMLTGILTGGPVGDWLKEKFGAKIRASLSAKLKPELDAAFRRTEILSQLQDASRPIVKQILDAHHKFFMDDLKRLSRQFEIRYDETEKNRRKSQAELEVIANHAKEVREQISVLRAPLQEYQDEILPCFS